MPINWRLNEGKWLKAESETEVGEREGQPGDQTLLIPARTERKRKESRVWILLFYNVSLAILGNIRENFYHDWGPKRFLSSSCRMCFTVFCQSEDLWQFWEFCHISFIPVQFFLCHLQVWLKLQLPHVQTLNPLLTPRFHNWCLFYASDSFWNEVDDQFSVSIWTKASLLLMSELSDLLHPDSHVLLAGSAFKNSKDDGKINSKHI